MKMKFKFAALFAGLLLIESPAMAEESLVEAMFTPLRQKEINPVNNKQYKDECGSCHFAYQPGLLPSKSWEKLLNEKALADHFGENAELDREVLAPIYDFVMANAADKSYYKRARKITNSTEGLEAPLRITEVRYIKRKHHEIPERMIKGNKDVKSLSYCDACHTQADKGIFDEDTVRIPNFPDWED
ncbi:MAG: diheme cytochrome c [Sideroxydans sp.]|nr:diheme cytochrome c [Sideroxydans sp.]